MAWMIRQDQLDPQEKDFINQVVNSTDKNLLYVSLAIRQFIDLAICSAIRLKDYKPLILVPNNFIKAKLSKCLLEVGVQNIKVLLIEELSILSSDNVFIFILPTQEQLNKQLLKISNRILIFSDTHLERFNGLKITHNLLYRCRNSQRRLSNFICNTNNTFLGIGDNSKVDSNIFFKEFTNEKEELEYIFQECNKIHSTEGSTIILFSNEYFLLRFVFFLFDKAFFDLASIDGNSSNIIKQSNELLRYYGMPYLIINDEFEDIEKMDNKNKILLCTFINTRLLALYNENFDFGVFPFTQKIEFKSQRVYEISRILLNLNFNRLAITNSKEFIIPNSLIENIKISEILKN